MNGLLELARKQDLLSGQPHMTEMRKINNDSANQFALQILKGAKKNFGADVRFLAVENLTGKGSSDSLLQMKQTYLMMLMDLIALAEATIQEDADDIHLSLKIATRTFQQMPELSTLSTDTAVIEKEILARLRNSFELDLASRGLLGLIDEQNIEIRLNSANYHPGLILADITANTIYNRRHSPLREFVKEWEDAGNLRIFTAFGGNAVRRALVAERDNQIDLALYRWLTINISKRQSSNEKERADNLQRLCDKVLARPKPHAREAIIDAVIEMLLRNYSVPSKYAELAEALGRLEVALEVSLKGSMRDELRSLLFRVRTIRLQYINHYGDIAAGQQLVALQDTDLPAMLAHPQYFILANDYYLSRLEVSVNKMDFAQARVLAESYRKLYENFCQCWELLGNREAVSLHHSRLTLRVKMTDIRTRLYITPYTDVDELHKLADELIALTSLCQNPIDEGRRWNYLMMALLKAGKTADAISLATEYLDSVEDTENDSYRILTLARTAVDGILGRNDLVNKFAARVWRICENANLEKLEGHPYDLLYREKGMLTYLAGKTNAANIWFRRAEAASKYLNRSSPIVCWLRMLLAVHVNYMDNPKMTLAMFFAEDKQFELIQHQVPAGLISKPISEALPILRRISPY